MSAPDSRPNDSPASTPDAPRAVTPDGVPTKKPYFWHVLHSMRYSLSGFAEAFRHEQSFREDLLLVALLFPLALILPVNAVSTAVMLTSLLAIIVTELLNSAIEWTIEDISPAHRPLAKRVKDMASAAVFLSFVNCIIIWTVIIYANWERIKTFEFIRWPPVWLP